MSDDLLRDLTLLLVRSEESRVRECENGLRFSLSSPFGVDADDIEAWQRELINARSAVEDARRGWGEWETRHLEQLYEQPAARKPRPRKPNGSR